MQWLRRVVTNNPRLRAVLVLAEENVEKLRHESVPCARLAAEAARYTLPPAGLSPAIHVRA